MNKRKLKALLIIEQCNPEWASVPLEGYRFYEGISKLVDATLVTHECNREAIDKLHPDASIIYIKNSNFIAAIEKLAEQLSKLNGQTIWPLFNALNFPVYWAFNHSVYSQFKDAIERGDYDIIHAITPMMPRYPVKAIKACKKTPFIIGPVNGGVPFPEGFKSLAKREFAYLNFLRWVGRVIIPGYRETYQKADYILAGSTYTLKLLRKLFSTVHDDQIELFYENGITSSFVCSDEDVNQNKTAPDASASDKVNLLFVGRLVPYKGADMLLDAIDQLDESTKERIYLTIVGDDSERANLESQVQRLNLGDYVTFTGDVPQQDTLNYYKKSDIFCFPSVREFGGAVVLEAMASALPCIVVDNGGIGEYVTEKTGFKISPISREYVVKELTVCIKTLVDDHAMRNAMSQAAHQRAKEFTWDVKNQKIVDIYSKILQTQSAEIPTALVPEHV